MKNVKYLLLILLLVSCGPEIDFFPTDEPRPEPTSDLPEVVDETNDLDDEIVEEENEEENEEDSTYKYFNLRMRYEKHGRSCKIFVSKKAVKRIRKCRVMFE